MSFAGYGLLQVFLGASDTLEHPQMGVGMNGLSLRCCPGERFAACGNPS